MAQPKEPPGLVLPEQAQAGNSSFLTSPKRLEQWVKGLPRAHIGETSRHVYHALRELNQFPLGAEQRLTVLETLAEPIEYVVHSLRKHVLGQAFPLTPKKQKVSQLIREILHEAATGYRIYLENIVTAPQGRSTAPTTVSAVERALHYGLLLLFNAYQTYAAPPKGAWMELHKLYAFAVQHGLHELPTNQAPGSGRDTIDDTYKRILLLALVNPYQLSQDDIQRMYDSLYFWAPYCVLTPMTPRTSSRSMFAVNPASDDPPAYYAYCTVESRQCLLLDTRALVQQVRELVTNGNAHAYPPAVAQLPRDALKRMLLSWGSLSKRAFTRRGNSAQVKVTLGLSGTYKFLAGRGKQPVNSNTQSRATFSSQMVGAADGSGLYPPVWDLNDSNAVPSIYDQARGKSARKTPTNFVLANAAANDASMSFNITNESAGGYCLLWKQSASGALLVGDMVCIHDAKTNHCNICVIRWMKNVSDKMVLGVEILSPCAQPTSIRIIHGDGARGDPSEGLLLPPVSAVKRPVTLLTAPTFRGGDVLALDTPEGPRMIRLTHLQQSTRSFKQFQFAEVEVPAAPESEDEAPGFDNIWSSL